MNKFFTVITVAFTLFSCASKSVKPSIETKEVAVDSKNKFEKFKKAGYSVGTVLDKTGVGGCSFVIQTQDSTFLEPIGLDESFKKSNLQIAFKFRPSRAMSTCMMGKPAVIADVQIIE